MNDTNELLPCPFCGGEAEIERKGTHRQSMQYACTNCGARCESGDVYGLTAPGNYKWNARYSPPSPTAQGAEQPLLDVWEARANAADKLATERSESGLITSAAQARTRASQLRECIRELRESSPLPKESEREARLEAALKKAAERFRSETVQWWDAADECERALTQST